MWEIGTLRFPYCTLFSPSYAEEGSFLYASADASFSTPMASNQRSFFTKFKRNRVFKK